MMMITLFSIDDASVRGIDQSLSRHGTNEEHVGTAIFNEYSIDLRPGAWALVYSASSIYDPIGPTYALNSRIGSSCHVPL
jgi:hypothetical protein